MKRFIFLCSVIICTVTLLFPVFWPKNEIEISSWGYPSQPEIAAFGRNVYVCWTWLDKYNTKDSYLYLQRSSDNGRGWLKTPIRIDRRGAVKGTVSRPRLAASGSYVYAVWRDTRNGKSDIYLNFSSDNGITWQKNDIRIDVGDKPGASHSSVAEIAILRARVYVVWQDKRNGKADIYFNYSSDFGVTWRKTPTRLDGDPLGAANSLNPRIAAVNRQVYVVWQDDRNGKTDIYFTYSLTAGRSWMSVAFRLDRGSPAGAADSLNPKIAASQRGCYVIWEDYRGTNADIYFNYTQNRGSTWQASDIRLDTGDAAGESDSLNPQIAVARKNVYVVWEDYRNEFQEGPFIYLNVSKNRGTSWLDSDMPIEIRGISANQAYPQIEAVGKRCCIVWRYVVSDSYDRYYIGFNFTNNKGKTWRKEEFWLNTLYKCWSGIGSPRLANSGDYFHATWIRGVQYGPVFYNGGDVSKIEGNY